MNAETRSRDAWVMSLFGLACGLVAGFVAIVVRRFFATDLVANVVALAGTGAALFGVGALVRSFARGRRATWRPRATAALLFAVVSLLLSVVVCGWLHTQTLKALADRSQKLVDALYAYRRDQSTFPERLDELVPAYLPRIPPTSMRNDPTYEYRREAADRFELWIDLRATGEGTRLFYRSASDYPPGTEVLRAWGFDD